MLRVAPPRNRKEIMTDQEGASILRLEGIDDIPVVRARMEPNGMVSVIRRDGGEADAREPSPAL
jgi:uncharacterized membrane protein YcaP (DUF421 family)